MKFAVRNRPSPSRQGVAGPARVDRRASRLVSRLKPGEIAVVDLVDIDRATAQALIDAGAVGVVDAAAMISGRYPNLGPQMLVEAGLALADQAGPEIFSRLKDGVQLHLDNGVVRVGDELVDS